MSDQAMKATLWIIVGMFLFFVGHYVGYQEGERKNHLLARTIKWAGIPMIKIDSSGNITCLLGDGLVDSHETMRQSLEKAINAKSQ